MRVTAPLRREPGTVDVSVRFTIDRDVVLSLPQAFTFDLPAGTDPAAGQTTNETGAGDEAGDDVRRGDLTLRVPAVDSAGGRLHPSIWNLVCGEATCPAVRVP